MMSWSCSRAGGRRAALFPRLRSRGTLRSSCSARIVVFRCIVPAVAAPVEHDGPFCLVGVLHDDAGPHWEKVLDFYCIFGHWIFLLLDLPTSRPLPTSVSRGG